MNQTQFDRLHNLNTVYYDFKTVLKLIKTGYRFDDEDAPAVLEQLEKALKIFKSEIEQTATEAQ